MKMAMKSQKPVNAGFSLMEMMIALTIIVIVSASLIPLMFFMSNSTNRNQNVITANSLASSRMEEIRATGYDAVGTAGGNPAGTFPQEENVDVNGIQYTVETKISWSAATGKNEVLNPAAFKNVSITVKGPNAFSGETTVLAELYSTFSRDGEEPFSNKGHIQVKIRDTSSAPVTLPAQVSISGPQNGSLYTDHNGSALFGMLNSGLYSVKSTIPDDMFAIGGDEIHPDEGTIQKNNVEVKNYTTTQVEFLMEKVSNASHLSIRFENSVSGNPVIRAGNISFVVTVGSESYTIEREFTEEDYTDGVLPEDIIGLLPPAAVCSIKTSGIIGYSDYDMSAPDAEKPLAGGTPWDGILPGPGLSSVITILLENDYLFEDDFDIPYDSNLVDNKDGTLALVYGNEGEIDLDGADCGDNLASGNGDNAFDDKSNTWWEVPKRYNYSTPPELWVDLGEIRLIDRLAIYSKKQTIPKGISVMVSLDKSHWVDAHPAPSELPYTELQEVSINPVEARYFKLIINSVYYATNDKLRILNLAVYTAAGYPSEGYRILGPIDVSEYTFAPDFRIEWEAEVVEGVTDFNVRALLLDEGVIPDKDDFINPSDPNPSDDENIAVNGGSIPGIEWGENLSNKRLWLMECFYTENSNLSPVLKWLRIVAE